jgi:hypothetical protein
MTSRTSAGSCQLSPLRASTAVRLCGRKRQAGRIHCKCHPRMGSSVNISCLSTCAPVKYVWSGTGIKQKNITTENVFWSSLHVIFEFFTAVIFQIMVFWVVTPCSLVQFFPIACFFGSNILGKFSLIRPCTWCTCLNNSILIYLHANSTAQGPIT